MNNYYENIAGELRGFFGGNKICSKILPFDIFVMFGAIVITLLGSFISFFSYLTTLMFYIMLVGMLMTLANRKDILLAAGCWAYAALKLILLLRKIFSFSFSMLTYGFGTAVGYIFSYLFTILFSLVIIAIWAGLGYLVFRHATPKQ